MQINPNNIDAWNGRGSILEDLGQYEEAIASLLNRSFSAKGITAKANLKGNCLRVMLESLQVPPQPKVVPFVHQGLRKLQAEPIKTVTIYGRRTGEEFPAWYQDLDLSCEIPT